ncbi:MAG: hypothetical protein WCD11_02860 [Solirubrobacteraceae bacterium]
MLGARGAVFTGLAGLALLAAYMSVGYDPFLIDDSDLLMARSDGPAPSSAIGRPILADDIFINGDASITWTMESLGARRGAGSLQQATVSKRLTLDDATPGEDHHGTLRDLARRLVMAWAWHGLTAGDVGSADRAFFELREPRRPVSRIERQLITGGAGRRRHRGRDSQDP